MSELIIRRNSLADYIVQLCRFLRFQKFSCTSEDEINLLRSIRQSFPESSQTLKIISKSVLVKNKNEYFRFNDLYDDFWIQISKAEDGKEIKAQEEHTSKSKKKQKGQSIEELKDWLYNNKANETKEVAAYSANDVSNSSDLTWLHQHELVDIIIAVRRLVKKIGNKKALRFESSKKKKTLDISKTIKRGMTKGLEIQKLHFTRQKNQKLKLLVFCDISKSMDLYSRFMIQFIYGFHAAHARIETFVFSSYLTRITQSLRFSDFDKCLESLTENVRHWSGGTNIGFSLNEFRINYGRKYLDKKTICIIISDGWDEGGMDMLDKNMKYLQKYAKRMIWINPLMSNPAYKPETKGMITSLQYLDLLTSVHDLESLALLTSHITI